MQVMRLIKLNFQNIQRVHTAQQQKTKHSVKNLAEDLSRRFSKEEIQMANRHMKRCSTALVFREMQIKTTVRYHLTLVRMAIIKKSRNSNSRRGCGEQGSTVGGNINWYIHYGAQFLKKTQTRVSA